MNIIFWDSETTGIPRWDLPADDPSQPHIVELAAILCDDQTAAVVGKYTEIVKPDGWTIPEGAAKVHGITTERAIAEGRPIAEVLDGFDTLLLKAGLSVCYNVKFDDKLLRGARRRIGRPDGFGTIPVFCCMRGATPLCRLPKKTNGGFGEFKTPKLSEAVKILLGRDHVGAHGAMADALATKDIYFACRDNHEFMAAGSAFKTNTEHAATPKEPPAVAQPVKPGVADQKAPQVGSEGLGDLFSLY